MKSACSIVLMLLAAAAVSRAADLGGICVQTSDCSKGVCDPLTKKCSLDNDAECSADTDKCLKEAECTGDPKECKCKAGFTYATGDTICAADGTTKGTCAGEGKGNCNDEKAICKETICGCAEGYTGETGKGCTVTEKKNGGACTGGPDKQGTCDENSTCSKATGGTCSCDAHYDAAIGNTCTAVPEGKYDGPCPADKKCTAENTKCESGYCVCTDKSYSGIKGEGCKKNSASGLVISLTTLMLAAIAGRMSWA